MRSTARFCEGENSKEDEMSVKHQRQKLACPRRAKRILASACFHGTHVRNQQRRRPIQKPGLQPGLRKQKLLRRIQWPGCRRKCSLRLCSNGWGTEPRRNNAVNDAIPVSIRCAENKSGVNPKIHAVIYRAEDMTSINRTQIPNLRPHLIHLHRFHNRLNHFHKLHFRAYHRPRQRPAPIKRALKPVKSALKRA